MPERLDLDHLILKYLSSELTDAEREELFRWRDASERNGVLFQELTDPARLGLELEKMLNANEEEAWRKVNLNAGKVRPGKVRQMGMAGMAGTAAGRKRFWLGAAAAVLVVLTGALTWLVLRPVPKGELAQEERFRNDVPPGKEGAVLVLADGTKVLLDSLGNGRLGGQSEAQMVKEGGQLSYEALQQTAVVHHTLTTPKGRKFRLVLADGTVVWLNAASSIVFPTAFPGATRQVVVNGEAYFEVAKDEKPFIASMDGMQVEVLGTHFNMNNYPGEEIVKTTLAEGSVRVSAPGDSSAAPVVLTPGHDAVLYGGTDANRKKQGIVIAAADLEEALSWTNNLFSFRDARIEQVMRHLERWYDIEVVYEDKLDQHFTGTIPMDVPILTVLKVLELTKGVRFLVEGRKVTVIKG